MDLIIRDKNQIVPIRPIPQKEIDQVNQWHEELFGQTGLDRAFFIGEHLLWWKDLIPHGKWEIWRKQTFPQISDRCAEKYMLLGKNREWLQRNPKAPAGALLGVNQALEILAQKKVNSKPNSKFRKPKIPKSLLEKLLDLWRKLDPGDRELFLKKVSES